FHQRRLRGYLYLLGNARQAKAKVQIALIAHPQGKVGCLHSRESSSVDPDLVHARAQVGKSVEALAGSLRGLFDSSFYVSRHHRRTRDKGALRIRYVSAQGCGGGTLCVADAGCRKQDSQECERSFCRHAEYSFHGGWDRNG